jgi:membrane-bound serine protease (ClpP class)
VIRCSAVASPLVSRTISWIFIGGGLFLAAFVEVRQPPTAGADPTPSETGASRARIERLTYAGVINPVAAEYLEDGIESAERADRDAVIIELDTPGGLDTSMRLIIKAINAATIPVIVYVAPSGSRAASAGTFITLAAHVAAMAPGTNIGSAHPVAMGGGEMDDEMKAKVENDAAAYIKSIAEKRGRNAEWAEEAVRKSVNVTEQEALALNVIDLVADDMDDLLAQLNGRVVQLATGTVTLSTTGAAVVSAPLSWRLRLLNALIDPNVAYVLMLLGTYGLLYELMSPGAILPGVVGAICLIMALYAFQTLPINYAGLLLILLAIVLFIAEVKVPSYGLLTVGGVVAMFLGSVMLMKSDLPYMRISLRVIVPSVLGTALFFVFVVGMAVRTFGKKAVTGVEELVGSHGVARSDLSPAGMIFIHGELWEARSDDTVRRGDEVEVTRVDGLRLQVKRRSSPVKEE